MALVYQDGPAKIRVSDTLERLTRAAVEEVYPGVLPQVEKAVRDLVADAAATWPVKTGVSRAGLDTEVRYDAGKNTISVHAVNDVPYAIFVRPKAWHGATTAWQRLVRGPMVALRKRVMTTLGPKILEILRAGAGKGA